MPLVRYQVARYLLRTSLDARDTLVRMGIRILANPTEDHYVVELPKGWSANKRSDGVVEIKDLKGFVRILSYPWCNEGPRLEVVHL